MRFGDRFRLVAGEHPFAWPHARHFPKATIQSFLACKIRPQKANLDKLVRVTGIPESWWLSGEGAPPAEAGPSLRVESPRADYVVAGGALPEGAILPGELALSVSYATRVLRVAQAVSWFPPGYDDVRMSALVTRVLGLLAGCAAGDRSRFERLLEGDIAVEAALRLALEAEAAAI
ncbi:hypothetical protein [uncultured Dechloromonas sp.]|uniref:hypothetical protein n=1 Tax=uncultured Dechloromonas sp. TaxID=171719 RepID=UPI0025E7B342|nr:hypothetical protein [uncultured Dechloromonas sp.]